MGNSTQIRALSRGLKILAFLNAHSNVTVAEIASSTHVARTTVYRILETLIAEDLVRHDEARSTYSVRIGVRSLSQGFDDEAWLTDVARPHMLELTRQIKWPVSIATPSGAFMLVRDTTDYASPLAIQKVKPGYRVPLLGSAAGQVYLAFVSPRLRQTLVSVTLRSDDPNWMPSAQVMAGLGQIRRQGYSVFHRPMRVTDRTTIAVPVIMHDRPLGALVVRFARSAVGLDEAIRKILRPLQAAADKIGGELISNSPPLAREGDVLE